MTREPGNLPERSQPTGVRCARGGRAAAVVTGELSSGARDRHAHPSDHEHYIPQGTSKHRGSCCRDDAGHDVSSSGRTCDQSISNQRTVVLSVGRSLYRRQFWLRLRSVSHRCPFQRREHGDTLACDRLVVQIQRCARRRADRLQLASGQLACRPGNRHPAHQSARYHELCMPRSGVQSRHYRVRCPGKPRP